ncbi:sine oculis-binding protein homolog A isoform X3 [Takifugu flavidus]|uniref:sine oculis-binding protein homolog A isoform X3 n=1 Tax=Takifugu flavidus TaxID=433684 RepID=UPI002544BA27|nr:sine oculis-binding protein homolog A isoform X3 [Takifugu flavidus]
MAETEKEGRPPENKRSRKPAHPVKREINEEMKSFAENTMNELLGWYGYDKVELRDSDNLELGETPQHISVLKENLLPRMPPSTESGDASPDRVNSSQSFPASRNGVTEPLTTASSSTPSTKEHGGLPIIVPMIPPPLIRPPADEDAANVQIMCAWCQKVGVKRYSLSMGSELKSFCSEKCFAACRRAYFKRNKAKDDDGLGGKLPQHSFTQDTPRLVFNTNSDVLVCDWCKHIRHTKEYLDFGAGERRLQFCSAKCLNQYKMDIFYKETQAALPGALCNPGHGAGGDSKMECSGVQLLTPESWGTPLTELRRKAPSPGGPSSCSAMTPSTSSTTSPSDTVAVCSPSSSSSVKIPTPRPHESPTLPPPPLPNLHPPLGVPSGSPPMVMTPRGPMPLPLFMEHQMLQQMRPPFLRSSAHPAGPNSPLSNPIIPGIGPPPPSRNICPTSSPMHRSLLSPHIHPSSNPNPGMMPPHPGLPIPGLPPFPPVNMIPNGRIPLPPVMNIGMPSLAPLVPPPTLLVPYPIIVPLPVPIPIPIPIPFSHKDSRDQPERNGPIRGTSESHASSECGFYSPGSSRDDRGEQKESVRKERLSPLDLERNGRALVDLTVKAEDKSGNLCLTTGLRQMEGVIDLTVSQRSCQQPIIQRTLPEVQVKVEAEAEAVSAPAPGLEGEGKCRCEGVTTQGLLCETGVDGVAIPNPLESSAPASNSSSSSCNDEPSVKQPNAYINNGSTQLQPQSLSQPQTSPSAPFNVIVNGTGWHPLVTPALPCPDQKGDHVAGEGQDKVKAANGELERDALKENNCSVREWEQGKRSTVQDGTADALEDKKEHDSNLEEGEHAYALPLLSSGGCVVIQPLSKPGSEKTAILSCSISNPISAAGSPELEPPLKRRCLRIRNQNK